MIFDFDEGVSARTPSTVADLKSRGVEFTQEIVVHGYGFVTHFTVPGGITIQLYEPKHQKRSAAKPKRRR